MVANTILAAAVILSTQVQCSPLTTIRIGGIFDKEDKIQHQAFQAAVSDVNRNPDILPDINLIAYVTFITIDDVHQMHVQACKLLSLGVLALFGPSNFFDATYVESICQAKNIPCLQIHADSRPPNRIARQAINVHPHYSGIVQEFIAMMNAWGWKSFAVVYEDEESLALFQDLFVTFSPIQENLFLRKIPQGHDFKDFLWSLKNENLNNIFLHTSVNKTTIFLKQAQLVGMITNSNGYIISNMDFHTINTDDYRYAEVNISGVRIMNIYSDHVQKIMEHKKYAASAINITEENLPTEAALMYDAVQLYGKAVDSLHRSTPLEEFAPLDCNNESQSWHYGNALREKLVSINLEGITGHIIFSPNGSRTGFFVENIQVQKSGLKAIEPVFYNATALFSNHTEPTVVNKTFKITTILSAPMFMEKNSSDPNLKGNDRYEGFAVDLVALLAKNLSFNYEFKLVGDNQYGRFNGTKWNGMIGEVKYGVVDMLVADVSVNSERAEDLDFTLPFLKLGISILYVKPQKIPPSMFAFLDPFSRDSWICIIVAIAGASLVLFLIGRVSPYELQIRQDGKAERQFTLVSSFWYTIGALMQQGTEIAPRAISSRMASITWSLFVLLTIVHYTAKQASFFTIEKSASPISSARDLAEQTAIRYGVVKGGSTSFFFESSNSDIYSSIWDFMTHNPGESFVSDNKEGVQRVADMEGQYAFFMESIVIEYYVERNCQLEQVGSWLDSKGYGIGLPKGSPHTELFNNVILDLQEKGAIDMMKERWWKDFNQDPKCEMKKDSEKYKLYMANFIGVFFIVAVGSGLGVFIVIGEFLWVCRKCARKRQVTMWSIVKRKLKLIFKCNATKKEAIGMRVPEENYWNHEDHCKSDMKDAFQHLANNCQ